MNRFGRLLRDDLMLRSLTTWSIQYSRVNFNFYHFSKKKNLANLTDLILGIVAGDIKHLSSASLLKGFWEYEAKYHSIAGGMIANKSRIFI